MTKLAFEKPLSGPSVTLPPPVPPYLPSHLADLHHILPIRIPPEITVPFRQLFSHWFPRPAYQSVCSGKGRGRGCFAWSCHREGGENGAAVAAAGGAPVVARTPPPPPAPPPKKAPGSPSAPKDDIREHRILRSTMPDKKFIENLSGTGKAIGVLTSGGDAQGQCEQLYVGRSIVHQGLEAEES
uniref:Uncharacterized protein n=1 Tax=Sphaerodactylus townsendi TaxID=933632 RepID=A0ACB8FVR3_9SAUR